MDAIPNFGAKKKPTRSSGIAAQKIATMTKGSDKLAKAAEEQAAKAIGSSTTALGKIRLRTSKAASRVSRASSRSRRRRTQTLIKICARSSQILSETKRITFPLRNRSTL